MSSCLTSDLWVVGRPPPAQAPTPVLEDTGSDGQGGLGPGSSWEGPVPEPEKGMEPPAP